MKKYILVISALSLIPTSFAFGSFASYIVDYLRGTGTYTLRNGQAGEGMLSFRTRTSSVLYVGNKVEFPSNEVSSFTINGHTLVPRGNFEFRFGVHHYRADNAFVEFADTSGYLQVALFHTAEPSGSTTYSFASYLLRRRGDHEFMVGPNALRKWPKEGRQAFAKDLAQWPELQQAVESGTVSFENFPEYIRRANQSGPN
jgi:hypothetical protein